MTPKGRLGRIDSVFPPARHQGARVNATVSARRITKEQRQLGARLPKCGICEHGDLMLDPDRPQNSAPASPSFGDTRSWLPGEDRVHSPFTGWTRHHWEATADHVLNAVRAHTTAGGSFVTTTADEGPAVGLEGFARASLLAAYRIATAPASVLDPLVTWLGRGVEVGTRPDTPDSWPLPTDRDQAIVEAAWVAIALFETREHLWDQLPNETRARVETWLGSVAGLAVHPNNWLLYPVIVDAFLQRVAGHRPTGATAHALRQVDAMYVGDGWYSDGLGTCFGHYSGWGIQLLLAHWLRMTSGEEFPGGPPSVRDRLRLFLTEYAKLVGADGAPVLHGRSLVYRFAAAAPFWMGELVDASPFAPGTTRRIASSIVRYFVRHGALDEGMPPLGWHGSFRPIADWYSTPTSPLLAGEGFAGLLLPPEHPVWDDHEAAAPNDKPAATVLRTPGFVCLSSGGPEGTVRIASHGASCPAFVDHPGYRKVAYSNRTAPAVGDLGEQDVDGQITVVTRSGSVLRRRQFMLVAAGDRYAASAWAPEATDTSRARRRARRITGRLLSRTRLSRLLGDESGGVEVETASIAHDGIELRFTHLLAAGGGITRDGGLALSHDSPPSVELGEGWCVVTTLDGLAAAVVGLHGYGPSGCVVGTDASPFGRHSAVPYVDGVDGAPESVLVTAHVLGATPVDAVAIRSAIRVEEMNTRLFVIHVDGEDYLVQLYRPTPIRVRLGGREVNGAYRYARASADGTSFALPAS